MTSAPPNAVPSAIVPFTIMLPNPVLLKVRFRAAAPAERLMPLSTMPPMLLDTTE